ncbi:MAG: radical SAM protein [Methanosarcinales archaeon]|jgi:DNA repair photolyase|nr:radical SAM protein [Methanosarcinales archaeon]
MEKQAARHRPIQCKTALHSVRGGFPYKSDLNIYRGCENGCKYCFAIYSHKYMNKNEDDVPAGPSDGYYDLIYAKTNVAEQLDKELGRFGRKKTVINIGGVCDSYQRAEEEFELMPDVLRVMLKHKNPIIISTKTDLILRDFDLIDELSKYVFVNIASTITTADENLRVKIEPGAVSAKRRFDMLEKFKKTDATIGVHTMPVLPFLTDSPENLEAIFSKTKEIGAVYIIVQTLYLRSQTRKTYFEFIQTEFPGLFEDMSRLYKTGHLDKEYKKKFYAVLNPLLKKYELSTDYTASVREADAFEVGKEIKQKTLFDF